jgi:hypothetical protein
MKEAFKVVKGNWLRYILEFFVIIISIISAFMLDNWHSQRQEYRKETLTLIDISDALSFDLFDLRGNMAGHDAGIRGAELVCAFLNDSLAYHDSLDIHFSNIVQEYMFLNENSAYESYKSNGTDLIINQDLRKALAKLYEFDYRYIQTLEETAGQEFLDANSLQYHSEKFNVEGRPGDPLNFKLAPRNPNLLQNDLEYKFFVNYQLEMRRYIYSRYVQIEKNVEEVILMIEAELKTR